MMSDFHIKRDKSATRYMFTALLVIVLVVSSNLFPVHSIHDHETARSGLSETGVSDGYQTKTAAYHNRSYETPSSNDKQDGSDCCMAFCTAELSMDCDPHTWFVTSEAQLQIYPQRLKVDARPPLTKPPKHSTTLG